MTELLSASSTGSCMQCPAVTTVSASINVTLQVERKNPSAVLKSTCTTMPTLGATVLRMSAGGFTQATFSQSGGVPLQNHAVAYCGSRESAFAGSRKGWPLE